jgi:hypothetical protein
MNDEAIVGIFAIGVMLVMWLSISWEDGVAHSAATASKNYDTRHRDGCRARSGSRSCDNCGDIDFRSELDELRAKVAELARLVTLRSR